MENVDITSLHFNRSGKILVTIQKFLPNGRKEYDSTTLNDYSRRYINIYTTQSFAQINSNQFNRRLKN